jgi:hypothetical protein
VSRFLKTRSVDRASKFVIMYLGDFHTQSIAGLLESIYDTHAYTEDMDSGCVDLTHSIPLLPRSEEQESPLSLHPLVPDWPVVWDLATTDDEIDEVRATPMAAEIEARQTTLGRMRELRLSSLELARELYALDSVTQNRVLNGFLPTVLDTLLARKLDAGIHEGEKMLTAPCDWGDIIARYGAKNCILRCNYYLASQESIVTLSVPLL